jgi:REP element-mobilizing transposase RayT
MARSYVLNLVHCVFSTKGRAQLIRDPATLWAYLRGIARNCKFDLLAVGGTANHVHMLVSVPSARNLSDIIRELKANSSRHMNELHRGFAWQDGYGAISVSPSQVGVVKNYIARQAEHHRTKGFDDEYLQLLEKAGVRCEPENVLG